MPTWQDEFRRLSELHRHEVERWLEGTGNANLVIDAGESEKAFLMTDGLGFDDMTESPELVSEAIIKGLNSGEFHVFPDTMAKQVGEQYEDFAKNIIEASLMG